MDIAMLEMILKVLLKGCFRVRLGRLEVGVASAFMYVPTERKVVCREAAGEGALDPWHSSPWDGWVGGFIRLSLPQ